MVVSYRLSVLTKTRASAKVSVDELLVKVKPSGGRKDRIHHSPLWTDNR